MCKNKFIGYTIKNPWLGNKKNYTQPKSRAPDNSAIVTPTAWSLLAIHV